MSALRFFSFGWLLALGIFSLASGPGWASTPTIGPKEFQAPFLVGPVRADPIRNIVYFIDATNNRLLAIDMTSGQQVYSAPVDDGVTAGQLAVSVDDSTLYLSETNENEIMVFALPDLAPLPKLHLSFPPESIACAVNGTLYAAVDASLGSTSIVQVNTSTGAIMQTFGTTEHYYYPPLLRANTAGTNLYAGVEGISGDLDIEEYAVSGSVASSATGYVYDSDNMIDFASDETYGRVYLMNGGIYGVNVLLTATDNYETVWPLSGAYAVGIGFNSSSNVVFGASGDPYKGDIREFDRSDGAPLADFVVATDTWPIQDRGVAATANNNVFYVRTQFQAVSSILGVIGSLPGPVTLYPTITQTITFPSISAVTVGETTTLQATDSAGLPITYTVLSGPATVSGNILTATGAGTVVIAANQAGNLVDKPATQVTMTLTVNLNAQTIAPFSTIPAQTFGTPAFSIALPTSNSGLPVAVAVSSGPATLSGSTITLTGAGVVTLTATQAGNSTYAAATPVTTSFTVNQASQTIAAFAAISTKTYSMATFTVASPKATSGLPTTISVQSGPATISGNTVTLTGSGTVVLVANQAGNANYAAAPPVTTSFMVNGATQTISAFKTIAAKTYTPVPFTITLPTASSGLPVTVTVLSGPATLAGNSVTLTGVGTVELAANQAGNSGYAAAAQVTTSFKVSQASQTISAFPIAKQTFGAAPFAITLPTATSGLPVTVTVKSGPATLSGDIVTLTGAGTVELVANQAGNTDYKSAKEVTSSFTVGKSTQTITAFAAIPSQSYGTAPFAITPPTASSGLAVTVKVLSGPAKISGNVVTLTGVGTVTLEATQTGNTNYDAATAVKTSFTVVKASQTISPFATIPTQTDGEASFTITLPTASSGLAVTVKVLSGPATISGDKIKITGSGPVVLDANQAGNADYNPAPEVTTSFLVNPE